MKQFATAVLLTVGLLVLVSNIASAENLEPEEQPRLRVHPAAQVVNPTGYNPTQIRHAYGFDQLPQNGLGQTIAIVDAFGSPSVQSDLNAFSSYYKIP